MPLSAQPLGSAPTTSVRAAEAASPSLAAARNMATSEQRSCRRRSPRRPSAASEKFQTAAERAPPRLCASGGSARQASARLSPLVKGQIIDEAAHGGCTRCLGGPRQRRAWSRRLVKQRRRRRQGSQTRAAAARARRTADAALQRSIPSLLMAISALCDFRKVSSATLHARGRSHVQ